MIFHQGFLLLNKHNTVLVPSAPTAHTILLVLFLTVLLDEKSGQDICCAHLYCWVSSSVSPSWAQCNSGRKVFLCDRDMGLMYFANCGETLEINNADHLVWSWKSSLQYFFLLPYIVFKCFLSIAFWVVPIKPYPRSLFPLDTP